MEIKEFLDGKFYTMNLTNKIYGGWLQINVSAIQFDGTIIDGADFYDRLYEHDKNDLSYIPSFKELTERYGKGLKFVKEFIIEVTQVTDDYTHIIKQIAYGVGNYE